MVICCRIRLNKRRQKSKSLMNTQLVVHHRALNDDEAATQVGWDVDDKGVGQRLALVLVICCAWHVNNVALIGRRTRECCKY